MGVTLDKRRGLGPTLSILYICTYIFHRFIPTVFALVMFHFPPRAHQNPHDNNDDAQAILQNYILENEEMREILTSIFYFLSYMYSILPPL